MGVTVYNTTWKMYFYLLLSTGVSISADTVLLLGGEVDDLLHPGVADVEAVSPCGVFESGVPDLPNPRRDSAAAWFGDKLIVCGGYTLLSPHKDCLVLTPGESPLEWKEFPSMIHGRDNFGLVVSGGELFAVGGSSAIGAQESIERFDVSSNSWEEFGKMNGLRIDFCTVAWGEGDILVVGGYDDIGREDRAEVFSTTDKTWSQLTTLNVGRGMHACTLYNGGVLVAGGWVNDNDDVDPGTKPTNTTEWYDPALNAWVETGMMNYRRTKFALEVVNGTLTALGGWDGEYTASIETMTPDGEWTWSDHILTQQKAGCGVVTLEGVIEDENCVL